MSKGAFGLILLSRLTAARAGYLDQLAPSALTIPTSWDNVYANVTGTGESSIYKTVSAQPETTFATYLDIAGKGVCNWLFVSKDASTNSVRVKIELTIDGVVVLNDVNVTDPGTTVVASALVGVRPSMNALPFIPFETQFKVRLKFSGATGNNAAAKLFYMAGYR